MLERFEGPNGSKSLITALMEQTLVHGDEKIAQAIADKATLAEIPAGKEIIQQGAADTAIHFIVCGAVNVVINGRDVAARSTGDHIGEMSLIDPTEKRSATVKTTESSVLATVSEPDFSEIAMTHPQLWRRIAVELGDRLRQRSKSLRQPNIKPLVFIGSSKEMLPTGELVKAAVKSDDIEVKLWTEGIFQASATSIESITGVLETYDFGVIIFGPDDTIESRGVQRVGPRDNAVFELGLLMGGFGRKRTFILKPKGVDIKIPSDLLGVGCLEFETSSKRNDGHSIEGVCDLLRGTIMTLGPR